MGHSNPERSRLSPEVRMFWTKTAIVLFSLFIFLSLVIPEPDDVVKSFARLFNHELGRVAVLGVVQNPVSLLKLSEIDERSGRIDFAILDMELAVGLLEMNGARQDVVDRYLQRLDTLRNKK